MREIKFRAWQNGVMEYSPTLFKTKKGAQTAHDNKGADYPLMQYIGRVDKNGKDVYEKDIITLTGWTDKYRVDWLDTHCAFAFTGIHSGDIITANRVVEIEIIGNVFEHPELVK